MLKAGAFLQNRYEIIYRIGSGGMADVYKAKDHKLNRFVAVKVLKQEFRDDSAFLSKFRVEAQAAAGMSHPNIVNVYDVGEDRGISYIVMELVEGITLKAYINKKGKLSVREATSIAMQVAAGLEAAHNNGIVHRDVKPQNILISMDGKAKVADFGIARAANANTISSSAMGSVHYSSPEQTRGGYSDAKSDIYSMGITMFEMLTGRVPFDGESTVEVALKHLQEEIPSPRQFTPEIPHAVEQIVLKCTQKSPDRRYANMGELMRDLRESLVNPNGNFVTINAVDRKAQTIKLSQEEMNQIRKSYMPTYDSSVDIGEASAVSGDAMQPGEDRGPVHEGSYYQSSGYQKMRSEQRYPEEEYRDDYEDYEEGYRSTGKHRRRREDRAQEVRRERLITVISIVFALLVVAAILLIAARATGLIGRHSQPATEAGAEPKRIETEGKQQTQQEGAELTVPDLSNETQENAAATLSAMGLKVSVDQTRYSDSVEKGKVITTNPGAGSDVHAGDTITIYVSQGTDNMQVEVLLVEGKYETEAKTALTSLGLYVFVTTISSDTVPEGMVITQDIPAGTMVPLGTAVTLTVSSGPAVVVLPEDDKTAQTVWKCNAQLSAPEGYNGEPVRITLVQEGEAEKTLFEGTTTFPYILNQEGKAGIASGTVYVYTLNPATWEIKQTTEYDNVVFSPGTE